MSTLHILFSRYREINLKQTLKMTFLDTFKSSGKYFTGPGQEKRQLVFQHLLNLTCYNIDLLGKIHAQSNNADCSWEHSWLKWKYFPQGEIQAWYYKYDKNIMARVVVIPSKEPSDTVFLNGSFVQFSLKHLWMCASQSWLFSFVFETGFLCLPWSFSK